MKPCCTGHDANCDCARTSGMPTHREALKTPSSHWLSDAMFWTAWCIMSVVIVYWAYQGAMDGVVW